ncbi:MAG: peroxiredoxin [Oscillatoriales cyanobacterium SM2_1_8]|nr:peroxiredoxin [Oscillatoriales cyanobacterium SM2_1_8]
MVPALGQLAPEFTLPSDRGDISLSAYRGKTNVLLAFYPGDFTPGCTSELADFAADWQRFRDLNAEILGISSDTVEKHREFSQSLGLPFPLLSDRRKEVIRAYGVNDLLVGCKRAYFLIDLQGKLRYRHIEALPLFKRDDSELLQELRKLKPVTLDPKLSS